MKEIRLKYGEVVSIIIERDDGDTEIHNISFDTIAHRVKDGETTVDLSFTFNNDQILF